ncbi:hypothetical protein [Pseudofrankia asymbiotica]|uniref:hypothetical protein n=1 Tax=Pseudofrankia asymbiotica TaxID=1834516 RepID=UPI001F51D099|nr:hypothetical protein [Pseudofrankia asymbiotica]
MPFLPEPAAGGGGGGAAGDELGAAVVGLTDAVGDDAGPDGDDEPVVAGADAVGGREVLDAVGTVPGPPGATVVPGPDAPGVPELGRHPATAMAVAAMTALNPRRAPPPRFDQR